MKYVVLILLLANGAYFAWEWTRPAPPGPQPDRGNIVQVSELETPPPAAEPVVRPSEPDVLADALAAPPPDSACTGLGPLADLTLAQALVERLAARDVASAVQPVDERLHSGRERGF